MLVMVKKRIFSGILFFLLLLSCAGNVYAQITPMPTDAPGVSAWRFDPVTTEVGKRAERARQFVNWILTHPSIDNHAVFRQVWLISSGVTFFLILLTVILMGVGVLVARKRDISIKVDIAPILWKVVLLLVYTAFSYWIVLGLMQATDILMQFFIKLLNADKLFRIFFAATSEDGYRNFVGYRDFDPLKQEMVKTSWFLIDVSSYTYFVMGIVVVLRKIVLWFLLIVAPFLALLIPFRLIRNTGWIWIGVFFQWAFYGPLFALFLGSLTAIWSAGIPFRFNFYRILNGTTASSTDKVVYPLSINILYGGPQQAPGAQGAPLSSTDGSINTSNYVDTFAEYVISLVMLWVVMILPWWLLRIFRDYCCEGIYAMKNILLNMLEQQSHGPTPGPIGPANIPKQSFSQKMQIPHEQAVSQGMRATSAIENMQNMKQMDVSEITRRMDVQIEKLSDIARFETKTDRKEYVREFMEKMRNPMAAESKEERSQFIKLKTEMSERAVKGDVNAQQFLNATTSTATSVRQAIQQFAQNKAQTVTNIQNISQHVNISQNEVKNITQSMVNDVVGDKKVVNNIANNAHVSDSQTSQVLQSIPKAVEESKQSEVIKSVAQTAGITTDKATTILTKAAEHVQTTAVAERIASQTKTNIDQVKKVAQEVLSKPATQKVSAPAELIARPQTMSIDEYEEVKKMWTDHYEKGEIPLSDTIKTRKDWVEKDVVSLNNTLNKLISDNEEVRAEGLQEVADVIPFFMLGNMSMQDIAAYLKAKVSAAQEIQNKMGAVEEVQQAMGNKVEEQFVDVEQQAEGVKEQTMQLEQEIEDVQTKSRESRVASQESQFNENTSRGEVTSPADVSSFAGMSAKTVVINQGINRQEFESILKRMDIQIQKLSDIARAQTTIVKAEQSNTQSAQEYKQLVNKSTEAVQEKIQQLSHQELSLMNTTDAVSTETKSTVSNVQKILDLWTTGVSNDQQLLSRVSEITHVSTPDVARILTTLSEVSATTTPRDMLTVLSEKTNIEKETVTQVVKKITESALSKEVLTGIATSQNTTTDIVKDVIEKVNSTLTEAAGVTTLQSIAAETHQKPEGLVQTLQSALAAVAVDQVAVESIAQASGMKADVIQAVIQKIPQVVTTQQPANVISTLVKATETTKETVERMLEKLTEKTNEKTTVKETQQLVQQALRPAALADRGKKPLDKGVNLRSKILDSGKMIATPKTMGIDEYEELKRMWIEHYTNGEVPFTKEITSRIVWVQRDAVILTNVLNKLVSANEEIKAQGLTAVSDIIPFFMLTDMTIQDIAMYLKAKLAAAQEVSEALLKEEELKKMLEEKAIEYVELPATAKEPAVTAELPVQEMKMDDSKNQS